MPRLHTFTAGPGLGPSHSGDSWRILRITPVIGDTLPPPNGSR